MDKSSTSLATWLEGAVESLVPSREENERIWAWLREVETSLQAIGPGQPRIVPIGPWSVGAALRPVRDIAVLIVHEEAQRPEAPEQALATLMATLQKALPGTALTTDSSFVYVQAATLDATVRFIPAFLPLSGGGPSATTLLTVPAAGSWHIMTAPDELFELAQQQSGGRLREIAILAQAWNRTQGYPLSPASLHDMAQRMFFEQPPRDLLDGLHGMFKHLASAVLEPTYLIPSESSRLGPEVSKGERLSRLFRAAAERVSDVMILEALGAHADASRRLLQTLLGELIPAAAPGVRIDVELDVFGRLPHDAIDAEVREPHAERHHIKLGDFVSGLPWSSDPQALTQAQWDALARGVAQLADRAKAAGAEGQKTVTYVIYGLAPLPVFAQLGMALSHWAGRQIVVNRRPDKTWDVLSPEALADLARVTFFDAIRGLRRAEPSQRRGRVAVFVSPAGYVVPEAAIRQFFLDRGESLAGLVEIRSESHRLLDSGNAAAAANELIQAFRDLHAAYPSAEGVALFIAGPAPLAFLAGRAINPNVIGTVLVTQYRADRYEPALLLPWRGVRAGHPVPEARLMVHGLSMQGYRGLGSLELPLDSRLTVLVGKNGCGKTSVLDCVATMLSRVFAPFTGSHEFGADDIESGRDELRVTLHGSYNDQPLSWTVRRTRDTSESTPLPEAMSELQRILLQGWMQHEAEQAYNLPLAVYYSVNRADLDIPARSSKQAAERSSSIYEHALIKGEADFRAFFHWFKEREDEENAERRHNATHEDPKLRAVRRAIESVLQGFRDPHIERRPLRMVVTKDRTELSLNQLSDGERSVLAMVGDLARRLCDANPALVDPLMGSAIVLIDELELHLHPGWQRRLVGDLLRTFLGCQFIITTHSPQVISEVPAGTVRLLRARDEGRGITWVRVDGAYGLDSNLILEELMETPSRPRKVQDEISAIYDLIDRGQIDEAEQRKRALAVEIGASYPELTRMEMRLGRARRARP